MALKKLSDNHKLFCNYYIQNGQNAALAYRQAFLYEDLKGSSKMSNKLMKEPLIQAEIKRQREELREKLDISKENILIELLNYINFNVGDVQEIKTIKTIEPTMNYETGNIEEVEKEKQILTIKDFDKWDYSQKKNIKSIEQTKTGLKLTFYDKMDAIEKVNKMLGYYDNNINLDTKIDTGFLKDLSIEELEKLLKDN